jgi:hypothetical protein
MPNPTDLVESDNKKQTKQDASQRLSEELSRNIFKLNSGGTAFRVADGRLVTAFHNINGTSELLAEQNGKHYRVGKNIQIDDINGLAVLEFVDSAPPQPKEVLSVSQRSLSPKGSLSIAARDCLRKTNGEEVQFQQHILQKDYPRTYSPVLGAWLRSTVPLQSRDLDDAQRFIRRPLLELSPVVSTSIAGGPVLSDSGEIVGVMLKSTPERSYAIPGEKVSQLLACKPEESKFIVTSGYENGVQKYFRDWERDRYSASMDTAIMAAKTLSFAGLLSDTLPFNALGFASVLYQGSADLKGMFESTNSRDRWYYGAALSADMVSGTGLGMYTHPRMRPFGKIVYGAGLLARSACELIPNRYVIQKIERRDGDSRPPFTPRVEY